LLPFIANPQFDFGFAAFGHAHNRGQLHADAGQTFSAADGVNHGHQNKSADEQQRHRRRSRRDGGNERERQDDGRHPKQKSGTRNYHKVAQASRLRSLVQAMGDFSALTLSRSLRRRDACATLE